MGDFMASSYSHEPSGEGQFRLARENCWSFAE
jgi:hypothetical protein